MVLLDKGLHSLMTGQELKMVSNMWYVWMRIYGMGQGGWGEEPNNIHTPPHTNLNIMYKHSTQFVSTVIKPSFVSTQNVSSVHFPSTLTLKVPVHRILLLQNLCFKTHNLSQMQSGKKLVIGLTHNMSNPTGSG
jgi:hypothetical protein